MDHIYVMPSKLWAVQCSLEKDAEWPWTMVPHGRRVALGCGPLRTLSGSGPWSLEDAEWPWSQDTLLWFLMLWTLRH